MWFLRLSALFVGFLRCSHPCCSSTLRLIWLNSIHTLSIHLQLVYQIIHLWSIYDPFMIHLWSIYTLQYPWVLHVVATDGHWWGQLSPWVAVMWPPSWSMDDKSWWRWWKTWKNHGKTMENTVEAMENTPRFIRKIGTCLLPSGNLT